MTLADRLVAKVEELAEAALDKSSENRHEAIDAEETLGMVFGDRATATVKALVALMYECDREWAAWTEIDDAVLVGTPVGKGLALLRDLAAALGVEEPSDGS